MTSQIYADSWNPIILSGTGSYSPDRYHHPICLSIISQLSQDIHQSIFVSGTDEVQDRYRKQWAQFVIEAIYQSLVNEHAYLIIDFGDGDWVSDPVDWDPDQVKPALVTSRVPTLGLVEKGNWGNELIAEGRYIKFSSPYRFPLARVLDRELTRHDQIMTGLEQTIAGVGLVRTGIDNLYEIMQKGGTALTNLTNRLLNLKNATRQDGVIAYDLKREAIDVQLKSINREPDTLRVIENRITAITGLPSFLIWGHTDGDGYGVKTSLALYDQRLQSIGTNYQQLISLILEITEPNTKPDYPAIVKPQSIYLETNQEVTDRMDKVVSALAVLQSIGAMSAIEVRNTVDADPMFRLVLDPNPTVITEPTNPVPNNLESTVFSG